MTSIRIIFAIMALSRGASGQPRFVLTGGPGVGKTTVINALKEAGYQTVPESYTALWNQTQPHHLETYFGGLVAFREKLMDYQVALEDAIDPSQPAFLDRSTVEIVAFGELYNIEMAQRILDIPYNDRYDLIFFLDPLPEELYDKPEELACTRAQSLAIHEYLQKAYTDRGFPIVEVPFDTSVKRMAFILEAIRRFK